MMSITLLSITQIIIRGNSPNKGAMSLLTFVEIVDNVDKVGEEKCNNM